MISILELDYKFSYHQFALTYYSRMRSTGGHAQMEIKLQKNG